MKNLAIFASLLLTAAAPLALAHTAVTLGDAGNTTGIRVEVGDNHQYVYFNCGRGDEFGNPSMDLAVLGGSDNIRDADFAGPLGIVPDACRAVGTLP